MSKNAEDIWNRFRYYAPSPDRADIHQSVRSQVIDLALALDVLVPDGREKALVFTKLEEALFWANAGIARQ